MPSLLFPTKTERLTMKCELNSLQRAGCAETGVIQVPVHIVTDTLPTGDPSTRAGSTSYLTYPDDTGRRGAGEQ